MFRFNKRAKELFIDVLTKSWQAVFVGLVLGPIVTKQFDMILVASGAIASTICFFMALAFAVTIREHETGNK